jgi:hypothetical protein
VVVQDYKLTLNAKVCEWVLNKLPISKGCKSQRGRLNSISANVCLADVVRILLYGGVMLWFIGSGAIAIAQVLLERLDNLCD